MSGEQWLFIVFVLAMAALVVGAVRRCVGPRPALILVVGLGIWFIWVAILSQLGVLQRSDSQPPGMIFILGPVVAYLAWATVRSTSKTGASFAAAFPLGLIIGLQAFRVVVEVFIHRMWAGGLVPEMLTFRGANVDLYVGATAPIIALIAARSGTRRSIALAWNVLGLLSLANVVTRAILTAPGPLNIIHADLPNRMFATFPFMFIPAFFVPLAVTLHILAIRQVLRTNKSAVREEEAARALSVRRPNA
jgi:hypothetical protein